MKINKRELREMDTKFQTFLWLLIILVSYSVIDHYINYLLEGFDSGGYTMHIIAIAAIGILIFGIFTGRKISK